MSYSSLFRLGYDDRCVLRCNNIDILNEHRIKLHHNSPISLTQLKYTSYDEQPKLWTPKNPFWLDNYECGEHLQNCAKFYYIVDEDTTRQLLCCMNCYEEKRVVNNLSNYLKHSTLRNLKYGSISSRDMCTGLSSEVAGLAVASTSNSIQIIDNYVRRNADSSCHPGTIAIETGSTEPDRALDELLGLLEEPGDFNEIEVYLQRIQTNLTGTRLIHDVVPNINFEHNNEFLRRSLSKYIMEDYSPGPYTETTHILSTTANMGEENVVALELPVYPSNGEDDDFIATICSPVSTSLISQNIFVNRPDNYVSFKSEGESGEFLIKLEIYHTKDIANLDKSQWWRQAKTRVSFLTQNPVDPLHILVEKTNRLAMKRIAELENVKKEVKKKNSWSGLNSFWQAPY